MKAATLEAAVGPDGEWEAWMALDTAEKLAHALALVERSPRRWRIA